MNLFFQFTLGFIFTLSQLHSQSVSTAMGARAAGIGYATATLGDEWALLNNVGGLAAAKRTTVAVAYDARPSLTGANRAAAVVSGPALKGTLGVGVFSFGDNLYSEQLLTAGYGNKLGIASLGIKANYIQYRAQGFGIRVAWSLNFGGIVEITPKFLIGAYIVNINQPLISSSDGEHLPTQLITGIRYQPQPAMLLMLEVAKDLEYALTFRGGFEYTLHKKIKARTGFNLNPNAIFFGIGYDVPSFTFDYGIGYDYWLQASFTSSLTYRPFRKKHER